ncbi:LAMI_0H11430g1_1 [Lachancea mirantina]|uniref:DNA mismatch repair protein HSM3 n=1 Tax=Lachancea mirantina TaxID=1230905 RepID=A0A1G4KH38_9SACH|nr:LAMI_0H11430g1_1 [Lachancea mirantina]
MVFSKTICESEKSYLRCPVDKPVIIGWREKLVIGDMTSTAELLRSITKNIQVNDTKQLNASVDKALLQIGEGTRLENEIIVEVLQYLTSVLDDFDDDRIDFDNVIGLMNKLIDLLPYEIVLELFSVTDLKAALNSQIPPLMRAACKVISLSSPKGVFANSELFDLMLRIMFDPDTKLAVVNEIENTLRALRTDELVRRRILQDNMVLLIAAKESSDVVVSARLLELLSIFSDSLTFGEFNTELFAFSARDIEESAQGEIFQFINLTNYYIGLLECIRQSWDKSESPTGPFAAIFRELVSYGEIYSRINEFEDVNLFGRSYVLKLFQALSYLQDQSFFGSLDKKYSIVAAGNSDLRDLLTLLNPEYLLKDCRGFLENQITIKPTSLPILRNILKVQDGFALVQPMLTSEAILAMPYLELMAFLDILTLHDYSTTFLLESLPKVISSLIEDDSGRIIEPLTVRTRAQVLERLLELDPGRLTVWHAPLLEAHQRMTTGKYRSNTIDIAESYL